MPQVVSHYVYKPHLINRLLASHLPISRFPLSSKLLVCTSFRGLIVYKCQELWNFDLTWIKNKQLCVSWHELFFALSLHRQIKYKLYGDKRDNKKHLREKQSHTRTVCWINTCNPPGSKSVGKWRDATRYRAVEDSVKRVWRVYQYAARFSSDFILPMLWNAVVWWFND